MRFRFLALSAAVALLSSGPATAAAQAKALAAQPAASQAKASPQGTRPKLVDINSAGRRELKTLPGIGDAEAAKIIAGRPYLTKAHLVTRNVLTIEAYDGLKGRIIAVQKTMPKVKMSGKP